MELPFAFESPEWLKGLWALPVIVVFYLFRKRARRLLVPFLPFWEKVFAERKRRPSIVRTLVSILLQLLAAATILVALAHPYRDELREMPVSSIVVVDRSLGTKMAAGEGTLADATAARGREVLARAAAEGPVAVAILREGLEPRERNGAAALDDPLPPPEGARRLDDLVTLRRATDPGTRIIFVTPFAADLETLSGITVVGSAKGPIRNGGIRAVTHDAVLGELVVTVDPGGEDRTLRLVSDQDAGVASASVAASHQGPVRLRIAPDSGRGPTLRLDPPDAFPDDDVALLALPEASRLRVVLASDTETPALDSALVASAVMDTSRSGRVKLAELESVVDGFDVAIVVGPVPELPAGRYFLIDSVPQGAPIVVKDGVGEARPVTKSATVPWLAALDVDEWRVHRMRMLEAGPGLEVLVDGTRGPLVARFDREDVRAVVLTVSPDLSASTLPLLPAFPLILRGALLELAPRASSAGLVVHRAGGRIVLGPAEAADVRRDDGSPFPLRLARDGGGYELPLEAGRFTAGPVPITTAWLDHPALPRDERTGDDPWPGRPRRTERRSHQTAVLVVLLAVLLAEWCSYHFGSTD